MRILIKILIILILSPFILIGGIMGLLQVLIGFIIAVSGDFADKLRDFIIDYTGL